MSYVVRDNPAAQGNYTPGRLGNAINKIIIHHAATTDFDGIGRTFQGSRGVSAHYGVGSNNNVDRYVSESDIAYSAGNWPANCTSVSIENVNSTGAPEWGIADSTFATLVELTRDIAKRNGLFPVQVGKTLFGHKDFSATACPGKLYARLQELADAVNNGAAPEPTPAPGPDQVLEVGSNFVFDKEYRVDNLALVGGIWQIQTVELCKTGFTWDDNGVPAEPVFETSDPDQVLSIGSRYKIPGTFRVMNLGYYGSGMWMAQIKMGAYTLWVDVATVREV